ncbi:Aryl-alcohol dehydrogenase [Fulvia fulva]|uniref:Aryl-alcohol dehydrogenase n=1 Tax=Passalora fulva TaxID=5499 RepID=A0A9Q8UR88_PASFU|nr:Aryl-alcohol dehydrogenase [Fulvia fulva]KAK4621444.1 Aryl-alcohol dehydrogenase [Fulvia fulva]KAK4622828.1 Aryl-alcohol dehydrogenase [Fulvia fulva]UJO19466.1 Aryl-alcohol dehydrogenase [Fulvia fulva]WPV16116.1 Aryl-alcohol dehydrogenase [Fulvia fulva]WPV31615.1 Aryl-alcohol dehydrogenase [Fulvia fulva]
MAGLRTPAYVVHDAAQDFKLEEISLGEMQGNELLVEMKYSGICHTDLVFQQGKLRVCEYPAVFGHEGAGWVRAIGANVKDKDVKVGDFVLLSINFCEKCKFCRRGHPADCVEGTRLHLFGVRDDGTTAATLSGSAESVRAHFFGQSSFSRFSYVHETCVVRHPYPPQEAAKFAAMGCGYQTGAGTVLNILKPEPDGSIVVFGLGAVGLSALMAAKSLGLERIIAVDIQELKFPIAREVGATDLVNSRDIDIAAKLKDLTGGAGVDYAIDCTGVPSVIEAMLNSLAMRGSAATVGVPPTGAKVQIDPLVYLLGSRRCLGCREGDSVPKEFVPQLVAMQQKGLFPVEKLVKEYDYRDMEQALKDMHDGKVVKPVIRWS